MPNQPSIRDDGAPLIDKELTGIVISAFYFTYNVLGYGFLECVYRRALAIELRSRGLKVIEEAPIIVKYRGHPVGTYRVDLLVEDRLAVELKSTQVLSPADPRQLLNLLKAGSLDVGLLLHYGPEPAFHRLVHPRHLRN